jgi:uncharacterized OB-fold protein
MTDAALTGRAPIDDNLFAQLDPPLLAGSLCADGEVVFPATSTVAGPFADQVERRALPSRGTVWTWTTQTFAPKPPYVAPEEGFEPFVVGYVDLGAVLVESRIIGSVAIGDEVELRLLPLSDTTFTYAFEKVTS